MGNFYALSNYEMLTQSKDVENFVKYSNYDFQVYKNGDYYPKSKMFLKKVIFFPIKRHDINREKINNSFLEKNKLIIEKEKQKIKVKLSDMKSKNQYKMTNIIKCFTVINNEKYIILGSDAGDIMIYESSILNGDNVITKRLNIKEFKNQINSICELDNNTIAVSDQINNIKIIELNENLTSYSIIQEIKSDEKAAYVMIYLPILSYYKNRHHFCIADSDYIFIYKSNKKPKNLLILKNKYYDTIHEISKELPNCIIQESNINNKDSLSFNLIKKQILNAEAYSLIEINEKYIAAACIRSDNNPYIKFFDVNNNFYLKKDIRTDMFCGGNYIINLVDNRKILVVGYIKGFCLISTKTLDIIKNVDIDMKIISIGALYDNTMICCVIDKKNSKRIIEFSYIPDNNNIKESGGSLKIQDEIWDLKCFSNKIYFILKSSLNIFQK